jgi:hypothetical protein
VGLEQGPLSLASKTEELLERKRSGSSLETREYVCRDVTLTTWQHLQKLPITSPTSGVRSVGIVRSWTQATEFSLV